MDMFANLALGFSEAFAPQTLLYCFIGVFLGTFIGVLPGIGALATISMLLPLTFHVPPTAALVMLAGIYYGAQYGGSTASILLNLPGTPSAAVACLDGYPMGQQGRAGVALLMTTVASFVGSSLGIIILTAFSPLLADVALSFGPADYFAMMLLGLVAAATLAQGSPVKGISMVLLGLALGMVGTDVQTGQQRFTFGIPQLSDGISLVALAMGLFGVAEVIASINRMLVGQKAKEKITLRSMVPTARDMKDSALPMLRGTGVGAIFGALPGAGATIASFMSYAIEKKVARDPSRFGKGAIEGVTAPESANNAAAQTAFIPTLTLGIPGDAVMALMLGAMIIQGIQPGPRLVTEHPELFWGLIASFWIGNVMLVILNLPLIGIWVKMLSIPYRILYPAILLFICIGVYSVNNSAFDILLVLIFGIVGYGMMLLKFEPAPLILGFILGPLMEEHLRRAMLLSRGDPMVFLERPISASFLAVTFALLAWAIFALLRQQRAQRRAALATSL
ncbi:tripartite tricarboxylate transporter permease [Pseudoroseomonas wenyumeiae]|uniref:Tripartite tricarboxylate transporter permease n=1 Tax=Teichococcus wenyumeiae TaxID=2478470 RepID=A0A3A9JDF6_9PROT|nr:tripartite tricarboxylate transporter permease [Pseudoroseomonas wenyumeiae]RKK01666.1 tripartite tricarboxylate transporter permease [Pseudoroseomonas wenyumeiae]RMI17434.1 tripartite tricarboxylate transporter permease [Pseudoroseomonas wenyumeiae]